MEFILGALTAVVFFILLIVSYWLGTKQVKSKPQQQQPMDDKHREKIQRLNKHFEELFSYDVEKARGKKVM